MSGLRHVQFYDNDTLLWSNNSNYSPASSQFVIALFSQGLSIIDYIAHTSVSIFYSTFPLSQRPHLQPSQQSASELRAAAERPLFAHRYERESLRLRHDLQHHPRLRSLPQLPIPPPLQSPRRRLPRPFLSLSPSLPELPTRVERDPSRGSQLAEPGDLLDARAGRVQRVPLPLARLRLRQRRALPHRHPQRRLLRRPPPPPPHRRRAPYRSRRGRFARGRFAARADGPGRAASAARRGAALGGHHGRSGAGAGGAAGSRAARAVRAGRGRAKLPGGGGSAVGRDAPAVGAVAAGQCRAGRGVPACGAARFGPCEGGREGGL